MKTDSLPRNPKPIAQLQQLFRSAFGIGFNAGLDVRPSLTLRLACFIVFVCSLSTGCQRWPGTQAMRQYQVESDRLLSEFRAQKKRADELEQRNVQLEQRLAESEKQVAKMLAKNPGARVANRNSDLEIRIGDPRDTNVSESSSTRNPSNRRSVAGLPEASPGTPGYFTSGGNRRDPKELRGDPSRSDQWRPITNR